MNPPFPRKKTKSEITRSFFIENLIPSSQIRHPIPPPCVTQIGGGPNFKKPEDYIEKLEGTTEHNIKFNFTKCRSKFIIKDVPEDPESLLLGIFQYCIDNAIEESREKGIEAQEIGCIISSELLDPDIWIPIRKVNDNIVEAILNRFLLVAQSKKQNGITLWGRPFTVMITALDRKNLSKRRITGGAARKLAHVHHRINKNCLIKIQNLDDKFCLFYALQATLVQKIMNLTKQQFYDYLHGRSGSRGRLQGEVAELMRMIGAPMDLQEYDADIWVPKVVNYWNNVRYVDKFRIRVFIFGSTGHYKPILKYGDEEYDTPILLYYDSKHFDGVSKMGGLFGQRYCLSCEKPFHREQDHSMKCRIHCLKCARVGLEYPCKTDHHFNKLCTGCGKKFNNKNCYSHHLANGFCKFSKLCTKCGVIYRTDLNTRNKRDGHVCGEKYCGNCGVFHDPKRGCFIRSLEPKAQPPCRYITFDIETTQDCSMMENDKQKYQHLVNFIGVRITCSNCIAAGISMEPLTNKPSCSVCGKYRTVTFSERPFVKTIVDRKFIIEDNPLQGFVKWLLYGLPLAYDSIVLSHFGGRFDMIFVFRELFLEGMNPSIIRKGNKLYEMQVQKQSKINPQITFRDSYNLMPMSLAALVPSFGLNVEDKPFFPFMANRASNYGKEIFPTKNDYLADGMMPAKRAEFDRWYEQHGHVPFLLDEALASYCMSDVDILMSALIAFRREFLEVSSRPQQIGGVRRPSSTKSHEGIDVLRECMTIASASMRHFRTNHLRDNQLCIVPERGYDSAENQSLLTLKFFDWYAAKNNVHIQTARSPEGEKKVANYRLDGWIEEHQMGIEINGCAWHGCPTCYPNDNMILPNGKAAGLVRELDQRRLNFILTQVPSVTVYWECEIRKMLEKDGNMRQKFDCYLDDGPIDIRSCFYGGRTGPLKLFHEAKLGEKISYFDVRSLYPFINSIAPIPIGIPKVKILNEDVNWTMAAHNPFPLSIIKCFVVPPRRIDVPILPVKLDDRLLFPLCAKCAGRFPTGAVDSHYSCTHSDQERGWVSTCASIELNAALEEGYIVTKVFRVLEYEESSDQIFRSYMSEFMAQKIHASGFEEGIRGDREAEDQFIKECQEIFGISIDKSKMVPNKGKRALAKLALNNLWGRFSLNNFGMTQCHITDNPEELAEYLDDKTKEVVSLDELTTEVVLISYIKKKDWIEEHACSNVIISLWTTAAARLHLLKAMQNVVRSPGCTLLYTDTDSLIYAHPEHSNPLQTGPHLGEFTDEYPHHHILEFCSGGAKQYGLKLQKKDTPNGDFNYVLKVRGMTLNYDVLNRQGLRFETFKQKVLRYANTGIIDHIQIIYPHFLRPSITKTRVMTETLSKVYKPFVGKGIVNPNDYRVLDFGYVVQ